jgi:hypothetical protein
MRPSIKYGLALSGDASFSLSNSLSAAYGSVTEEEEGLHQSISDEYTYEQVGIGLKYYSVLCLQRVCIPPWHLNSLLRVQDTWVRNLSMTTEDTFPMQHMMIEFEGLRLLAALKHLIAA